MSGQNLERDLMLQVGSLEETVTVVDPETYDAAGPGFIRDLQVRHQTHPDFASAAISAASEWQWDQTLLNCVPVEVFITVTVRFMPAR